MNRMNIFKKILLTIFALLFSCVLIATTNAKAWTQDCDTIDEQIHEALDEINSPTGVCELWMTYRHASYMQECLNLQNQYHEMQEWSEGNCVVTP